jgi:ABC-type multidrug transport system fused ATPase/permease subunit
MVEPRSIGMTQALRQLFGLMTPQRRRQFFRVLGWMLVGAAAEVVLVASVVPFLALLNGQSDLSGLGPLGELVGDQSIRSMASNFILAALAATAIRLWLSWSSQAFVLGIGHDLAVDAQRRVLLQPYSFHLQQSTSTVIASLDKIRLLVFGVLRQVMVAAVGAVVSVFILALLLSVDPVAALAAFGSLALFYLLISRLTSTRLDRNSQVAGAIYDRRVQIIQESLGGIRDLIIDQTQPLYLEEFRKVDERLARAEATNMFIAGTSRYLVEGGALILIAVLALALADREGRLGEALPVLGAVAVGGLRLLPLIQQAFASWATMAANRSVIGQVLDVLRLPVADAPAKQPSRLQFTRDITLDGVSFGYPGRAQPAVSGASLVIARGARVALVGKTGGGKSTLADLVMGLLEPDEGRITVDEVALTAANRRAWQANIAHVPQAVFLADASIARNIAFSVAEDAIDLERVRRAADVAELAEFIDTLPDGLETLVGERGVRLSGGQRQRLGIARAVYKDAPMLVLDEATNALDRETEGRVLENLMADPERTILVIAHRQSTVAGCDQRVRIDKGRIVIAS